MEKTWGRYQTKPEGCLENFYQIGFHISQYVILCHIYLYIYMYVYIIVFQRKGYQTAGPSFCGSSCDHLEFIDFI
jgi:hypothetical protein